MSENYDDVILAMTNGALADALDAIHDDIYGSRDDVTRSTKEREEVNYRRALLDEAQDRLRRS